MGKIEDKIFKIEDKYYKLTRHIDDGGNSSVWEAENLDKKYAIKILNESSVKKRERFENEIKFCKDNSHKNLVPIYAQGEINNKPCYVMPLYENNLAKFIKNGIELESGFDYIFQICDVIEFLHNKNVIHRDLKPENILIKKNIVFLADLGIAHFEDYSITSENELLANRGYAAPEQKIKGLTKKITTAADIFSIGLMINEIFTNEKPEGTNFKLISDLYPWLMDLDKLVERCMRQNPAERPTVKEVLIELKIIFNKLKYLMNSIKKDLEEDFVNSDLNLPCDKVIIKKIINQASMDIVLAKYLLSYINEEDIRKYNHNYHCNIHYKLDIGLRSDYMKYLIKDRCKSTFLYESNAYKNGRNYTPLNIDNNLNDQMLYKKFSLFLKEHFISDGELLKLFCSCCSYHCEEIIEDLENIEKKVKDLDDAPIVYIVIQILKIKDIDDLIFEDEILVNWTETISDYYNDRDDIVQLKINDQDIEIENILKKFREKYNAIVMKKDEKFLIRFEDSNLYNDFKNYALMLSDSNDTFNGDVLDLVEVEKEFEGIIELKMWDSFHIKNTLAKVMGCRKDY